MWAVSNPTHADCVALESYGQPRTFSLRPFMTTHQPYQTRANRILLLTWHRQGSDSTQRCRFLGTSRPHATRFRRTRSDRLRPLCRRVQW